MKKFTMSCSMFLALTLTQSPLAGQEQHLKFKVFLDNDEIGSHQVSIKKNNQKKNVSISADFDVKFLFLSVYRYQHKTEEVWKGNCLHSIDAKTNDNGENLFVRKVDNTNSFKVETHSGKKELNGCVRSFAYWDPELLKTTKLLNSQTGDYEAVRFERVGQNQIKINGKPVHALQYKLTAGSKVINLWYSENMQWIALKSKTDDGYMLSYYATEGNAI